MGEVLHPELQLAQLLSAPSIVSEAGLFTALVTAYCGLTRHQVPRRNRLGQRVWEPFTKAGFGGLVVELHTQRLGWNVQEVTDSSGVIGLELCGEVGRSTWIGEEIGLVLLL